MLWVDEGGLPQRSSMPRHWLHDGARTSRDAKNGRPSLPFVIGPHGRIGKLVFAVVGGDVFAVGGAWWVDGVIVAFDPAASPGDAPLRS